MRGETPTVRSVAGQDHPRPDCNSVPVSIPGDSPCEPAFASIDPISSLMSTNSVFSSTTSTIRRDARRGCRSAAFPKDREGDLRLGHPLVKVGEHASHDLMHRGVPSADESAEVATLPAHDRVESGIEGGGHPSDRAEGHSLEPTALDAPTIDRDTPLWQRGLPAARLCGHGSIASRIPGGWRSPGENPRHDPATTGPNGHVYIVSAARTPIGKFGGALEHGPGRSSSAASRSGPPSSGPGWTPRPPDRRGPHGPGPAGRRRPGAGTAGRAQGRPARTAHPPRRSTGSAARA